MDITKRNSALDIVRIFAMFSVISVHFFLNNGFYSEVVDGWRMFVMCTMRSSFMVCVPLFITLTGYLMCKKSWSMGYYKGIVKTLGVYVLASIACIVYRIAVLGSDYTFGDAVFGILNYTGAQYAWYIEMYIGLFLIAPFLNSMIGGLPSKKAKLALVVTLIVMTSLPSITNIFNFEMAYWWRLPYLSTEYVQFLPDWWTLLYPVTYYCIGAYLREFPLNMKKWLNILLWAAAILLFGWFNFYRSRNDTFAWAKYNDWYGLPNLIMTVLAFTCLSSIRTENWRKGIRTALMHLSDWCLGAYLLSFIFDNLIYAELKRLVPEMQDRLAWYLPVVLSVAILSLAASAAVNLIWTALEKAARHAVTALRRHRLPKTAPVLETERLILRPWKESDAEDLFAYAKDPDVGPRAGWKPHVNVEESLSVAKRFMSNSGGLIWAMELRETGHVIGSVGLHRHSYKGIDSDLMLGYSLSKEYWGRGLTPEASRAVIRYAFEGLKRETLVVSHFDGNEQSKRVIEKLGFTFVKRLENNWTRFDGEVMSENVYVMNAGDHVAGDAISQEVNKVSLKGNNLTRMS